jgi:hypothetical protein
MRDLEIIECTFLQQLPLFYLGLFTLPNNWPTKTMTTEQSPQYEVVLFGATGYTGKLCAEHIHAKLPSDLRWAIAGRSRAKLEALRKELQSKDSSRALPGMFYCHVLLIIVRLKF